MRVSRLFGLAMLAAWSAAAAPPASVLRTAGEVSPLGWPYSAFSEGTLDGGGRLVFAGTSTAVFTAGATPFAQRLGAGSILPDGRQAAGAHGRRLHRGARHLRVGRRGHRPELRHDVHGAARCRNGGAGRGND